MDRLAERMPGIERHGDVVSLRRWTWSVDVGPARADEIERLGAAVVARVAMTGAPEVASTADRARATCELVYAWVRLGGAAAWFRTGGAIVDARAIEAKDPGRLEIDDLVAWFVTLRADGDALRTDGLAAFDVPDLACAPGGDEAAAMLRTMAAYVIQRQKPLPAGHTVAHAGRRWKVVDADGALQHLTMA